MRRYILLFPDMGEELRMVRGKLSMNRPEPEYEIYAHQYLYYVLAQPIWSDYEYDKWCERHELQGGGGSDLESNYHPAIKFLAKQMIAEPNTFPST